MNKKMITSVLLGLTIMTSSAFAALPKEGVYEKHDNQGVLQARMYVMGQFGETQYSFGYGNEHAQVIWVEAYASNGQKYTEFATKYIWKTDTAGAAETALILDRQNIMSLYNGENAIPYYAQDMAVFSFDDNGNANVGVTEGFQGEPTSWKDGKAQEALRGKYSYVSSDLTFTPLSMAYALESTGNPNKFFNSVQTNASGNENKLAIRKGAERHEFGTDMLEKGFVIKADAILGNNVNMRGWTGRGVLIGSDVRLRSNATTESEILGMLDLDENVEVLGYERGIDDRGWYYVKKANGQEGFAAKQFIDLR